jgi:hypothetical protein
MVARRTLNLFLVCGLLLLTGCIPIGPTPSSGQTVIAMVAGTLTAQASTANARSLVMPADEIATQVADSIEATESVVDQTAAAEAGLGGIPAPENATDPQATLDPEVGGGMLLDPTPTPASQSSGDTSELSPTYTPTAPATLTPVPAEEKTAIPATPTVTATISLPAATATTIDLSGEYACRVSSQSPETGADFSAGAEFDAHFTLENTGSRTWYTHLLDYRHQSGTHFEKRASVYDLPKNVRPGESIEIVIDMISPTQPGRYTSTWALVDEAQQPICLLPIAIDVVP